MGSTAAGRHTQRAAQDQERGSGGEGERGRERKRVGVCECVSEREIFLDACFFVWVDSAAAGKS